MLGNSHDYFIYVGSGEVDVLVSVFAPYIPLPGSFFDADSVHCLVLKFDSSGKLLDYDAGWEAFAVLPARPETTCLRYIPEDEQVDQSDLREYLYFTNEIWETGFKHLASFYNQEGHSLVLWHHISPDGFRLGRFVAGIRTKYSVGRLSDERAAQLDSLEFVWDPREATWQAGYIHLRAYQERHGDCLVHANYVSSDGYRLGDWVVQQRQLRMADQMSPEQVDSLDRLGFHWD